MVTTLTAHAMAKFIYEDIICRWGVIEVLISDNGPETSEVVEELVNRYKALYVRISPYNSRANGTIEVSHRMFIYALRKLANSTGLHWTKHYHSLLWSERVRVRESTGMSPYHFVVGFKTVLPVEFGVPTWRTLPWHPVRTRDELLALRARQIEWWDEDTKEARLKVLRMKERNHELFNERTVTRTEPLKPGEFVLVHNIPITKSHSDKLGFRWFGPFRVTKDLGNGNVGNKKQALPFN